MAILSNGTAAEAVAPTTDLRKRLSQVKKAQCGASEKKLKRMYYTLLAKWNS